MKQFGVLVVLIAFVAAVSFVLASEQYKHGGPDSSILSGSAAVPGPGDPDGTGTFKITFKPAEGQVCYELTVANIGTATAAYLNSGARGLTGPVVVVLQTPAQGVSENCAALDEEKIADIMKNPANYYVNVRNTEFPDGAIRGQLTK
jgi:CHRD domain